MSCPGTGWGGGVCGRVGGCAGVRAINYIGLSHAPRPLQGTETTPSPAPRPPAAPDTAVTAPPPPPRPPTAAPRAPRPAPAGGAWFLRGQPLWRRGPRLPPGAEHPGPAQAPPSLSSLAGRRRSCAQFPLGSARARSPCSSGPTSAGRM